ncbi:MAG: F0F1 ATP synthase subunit delta [Salinisphaeraceae bacterium]|nr:F0F1 ATP synthase subunit delta [Salinisphaeraceae bacterium]
MAELSTLARPYAKAVFERAQAEGKLAEWSEMLASLATVVTVPEAKQLIGSPKVSDAKLVEVIGAAAGGLDEAGKNLLSLLVENRRLNTAPAIAEQYEALRAAAENRVDVDVVSASELSQAQQDKLSAALAKRLGRDVRLSCSVDAELLGGAVLKAGDLVIDGSLKADLQRLASAVTH